MAQHSMAGSADWARRSGWQSDDGGDGSGSEYGDGADGDGEEPPQPTTSNSPESAAEPGRGSGDGGAVNSRASSMQSYRMESFNPMEEPSASIWHGTSPFALRAHPAPAAVSPSPFLRIEPAPAATQPVETAIPLPVTTATLSAFETPAADAPVVLPVKSKTVYTSAVAVSGMFERPEAAAVPATDVPAAAVLAESAPMRASVVAVSRTFERHAATDVAASAAFAPLAAAAAAASPVSKPVPSVDTPAVAVAAPQVPDLPAAAAAVATGNGDLSEPAPERPAPARRLSTVSEVAAAAVAEAPPSPAREDTPPEGVPTDAKTEADAEAEADVGASSQFDDSFNPFKDLISSAYLAVAKIAEAERRSRALDPLPEGGYSGIGERAGAEEFPARDGDGGVSGGDLGVGPPPFYGLPVAGLGAGPPPFYGLPVAGSGVGADSSLVGDEDLELDWEEGESAEASRQKLYLCMEAMAGSTAALLQRTEAKGTSKRYDTVRESHDSSYV